MKLYEVEFSPYEYDKNKVTQVLLDKVDYLLNNCLNRPSEMSFEKDESGLPKWGFSVLVNFSTLQHVGVRAQGGIVVIKTVHDVYDEERFEERRRFEQQHEAVLNSRCNVVVPGPGLTHVTEVINLDDFCTQELQGYLNEGWHILAICVQPNQRRPDYILGRGDK